MTSAASPGRKRTGAARYRSALWLLTKRDLRVRYSTSALGYVWSIIDPLVMAGIYWFVFTVVFDRGDRVGEQPYIVFLLAGLLPWMWFTGTVSDSTRAFLKDAKLVRSTSIPRSIWVNRLVLSKGIEFIAAIPVLAIFALIYNAPLSWYALLFPLGILLQAILVMALGLIIAPAVVFFRDLERATKLILRFMFYASPIIYGLSDLPDSIQPLASFNPLAGIMGIYRSAFFPDQLNWFAVGTSALVSLVLLALGAALFRRSERSVLKEL
ncbi:ABC transporter permease [Microbacterium sp. MPKO10]|uniref:ABC transporter permease n=1 Tax=Microbacterium sp. MPKO10 TaxID=2989818 RepID=UPI002235EB52|nr:ABC transporter permease [Microbacterium sp. MPKO10]MCW4458126.1 ABC transporter permease [Microbacterium sp. MPKO10]